MKFNSALIDLLTEIRLVDSDVYIYFKSTIIIRRTGSICSVVHESFNVFPSAITSEEASILAAPIERIGLFDLWDMHDRTWNSDSFCKGVITEGYRCIR